MASSEQAGEPASAARFRGLAEIYAKNRPTYPQSALDFILERCALKPGSLLIDVGSGTGISSRLFAARGLEVIGIEPGDEMRGRAEAELPPPDSIPPRYVKGNADDTGLPAGSADAILSAQAFHWFEPEPTLREFHRLLKPAGWTALMWNERSDADPFTADVTRLMYTFPDAERTERPRFRAGDPLLQCPLFPTALRTVFVNAQVLDRDGLIGRMLSISYAPREGEANERFVRGLEELFARYQRDDVVTMHYDTTVYLGQRS
ncbi:MAG: class I SAM-dependent methyltransferase [Gemmataceae bacterium]